MKNKIKLTRNQINMIENHRDNFKLMMQKRYWDGCSTSLDNLSLEDILSACFDGYEVEKEWYETKDILELKGDVDKLILASNQNTWEDKSEEYPLYIGMESVDEKTFTGLTIEQMKEIRDYLSHKIDYLES